MNYKLWKQKAAKKLGSTETEFLPAVLEIIETPPSPMGRILMWTVVTLVVVALVWSIVGHTDEVAVAPGKLIPTGYVKVIQAEDKGIVKQIQVRDGQKVKQGDVLMELDPLFTAADLARSRKELAFYTLEIERMMAEREERPFTPQVTPSIDLKDLEYQQRLYYSRSAEFSAKKATSELNISQNQSSLEMALSDKEKYQALYDIAQDKENRLQQLVDLNAVAYFVLLDQRSRRMELEQNIASAIANIYKAQAALAQSRQALQGYIAEHNREIDDKLVDDRKQAQGLAEELKKAEEKNRLSQITSPIDGRVHQMAMHTLGGIVTPAQQLMIIVPEDVVLEAETWVANKDIGFIHVGQHAEIKVETFNFQKFGTIPAEVIEISPDAVEDKDKGLVYRAVLKLHQDNVQMIDRQAALGPGMSVTAEIKTQEKRIIEFFLDPFKKYQSEGLRER